MSKIESSPQTTFPSETVEKTELKKYKYKITVNLSLERNRAMRAILQKDPKAEFKVIDEWSFKVRTILTSNSLYAIFLQWKETFNIKNIWLF